MEDSLSEGSALSDLDEDADPDADDSELSEIDAAEAVDSSQKQAAVSLGNDGRKKETTQEPDPPTLPAGASFKRQSDTEVMMNGMTVPQRSAEEEAVDFEQMGIQPQTPQQEEFAVTDAAGSRPETFAERKRREHEEYRKKRDSDPTFIPNRGNFFMHDHRTNSPGQNGFKPFGRGRGRGRVAVGGPFSPAKYVLYSFPFLIFLFVRLI